MHPETYLPVSEIVLHSKRPDFQKCFHCEDSREYVIENLEDRDENLGHVIMFQRHRENVEEYYGGNNEIKVFMADNIIQFPPCWTIIPPKLQINRF